MRWLLLLITALMILPSTAQAQCSNPAGVFREIAFNDTYNVPMYCDSTDNWIAMVGAESCSTLGDLNWKDTATGNCYYFVNDSTAEWETAQTACQTMGGHLASINSAAEGSAIVTNLSITTETFIGGKDFDNAGDWRWYDQNGNPATQFWSGSSGGSAIPGVYSNWEPTQPNNTSQDYLSIGNYSSDRTLWADTDGNNLPYICEIPGNATQIVPSGLVGHWRLDETSGTTAFDSSGSGNDGAVSGTDFSLSTSDGVVNNAFTSFDVSDLITVTDDASINPSAGITVSAWVRSNIDTRQRLVEKWNGSANYQLWIEGSGNGSTAAVFEVSTSTGSSLVFGSTPVGNENQWFHITGTYDGSDVNIYVNGVFENSTSRTGTLDDGANDLIIGNGNGGNFNGNIDDVRIYNRALTAEEIAEIYAAKDGIRYNESHRTPEYFDGNKFVPMRAAFPEVGDGPIFGYPDLGCPNIGDVCSDGSVYAGLSPDGNVPMYMTAAASEVSRAWSSTETTLLSLIDVNDGDGNTALLIGTGNNYEAAQYCDGLSAHGENDWYLPAEEETNNLWNGGSPIGGVAGSYWTSTEFSATLARLRDLGSGGAGQSAKANVLNIRCVRKSSQQFTGIGGLVGHWKLDEITYTSAKDEIFSYEGDFNGGMNPVNDSVPGAVGTALSFDGMDDHIHVNSLQTAACCNDAFTIATWIYPRSFGEQDQGNIFSQCNDSGVNTERQIRIHNITAPTASIRGFVANAGAGQNASTFTQAGVVSLNEWQHIAMTFDYYGDKYARIFVNGAEVAGYATLQALAGTGARWAATDEYVIGTDSEGSAGCYDGTANRTFDGYIDDIRVYDRVLSTAEMQKLYNMGAPVGSSTSLPQGCPNIGDVCDDGTIYAGLSPDGNVAMFFSRDSINSNVPWNAGNLNGFTATGATNNDTGEANTLTILAVDADSNTAGFQTHLAAQHCHEFSSHGATDWYLPARNEIDEIASNYAGFNFLGKLALFGNDMYWSSTCWMSLKTDPVEVRIVTEK